MSVTENLIYSPEQSFGRSTEVDDFEGGLLTFRRSRLLNTTAFTGSYPLSRDVSLEGGYTFGLRRVTRSTEGGDVTGATFFNTMTHTWFGGPRYQLTRNDSIAALYRQTFFTQERSEGGRTFSSNLITLEGDYTKVFPEWTFTVRGGVTFIEPVGRTLPSGSIRVTTKPERDTVLDLTLSREARPSFFLQGGARINNSVRASIRHRIYERLSVSGSGGYALSQFFPNTDSQFQIITGASRLEYMLTRNIRGELFYTFTHINSDTTALEYQVSRHQVGFMLSVIVGIVRRIARIRLGDRGVKPRMHMAQAELIHHWSDFALSMPLLFGLLINTGIPLTSLVEGFRDRSHMFRGCCSSSLHTSPRHRSNSS